MRILRTATAAMTALLILVGLAAGSPQPVLAHTGLESSTPADGEVVVGPLFEVVLVFTGTPTAVDDGFAVADATGAEFLPVSVVQTDLEIVATFDPPLPTGNYALAWKVRSDDTHFIDGTFSFSVTEPAATTTTFVSTAPPTATSPPTTTVATAESSASVAPTLPATTTTSLALVAAPEEPGAPQDLAATAPDNSASGIAVAPTLGGDAGSGDGENVTRIGRLLLFPTAMAAIGILAFAALAFAGRRAEISSLLGAVRWLGVGVAFGALIEVVGLASLLDGYGKLFSDGVGRAALARIAAGIMLTVGFVSVGSPGVARRGGPASARSLSSAVTQAEAPMQGDNRVETSTGWRLAAGDAVGIIGVAILVCSFAFDGHTVSRGPRLLHAAVSILHVASAGVWAGGLVALSVVLWRRHRDGADSYATEMVVKFSVVAMVALTTAGAAGVVMAFFIDSDVAGYFSTEWGQLMFIKLGVVVVAAAIGAYNHFRLMPVLKSASGDPDAVQRVRSSVTTEAALVIVVALLTALLVAASTIG